MRKILFVAVPGLVGAISLAVLALSAYSEPTRATLDADLSALKERIHSAEQDSARYTGGLIKALVSARLEILLNSEAMLEQKKSSLVRFINLDYTIDGKSVEQASPEMMSALEKEVDAAKAEIRAAEDESARYAGGLLKNLADAKVSAGQLKLAMLDLRYLSWKWGIPVYGLEDAAPAGEAIGNPTPDDGAL